MPREIVFDFVDGVWFSRDEPLILFTMTTAELQTALAEATQTNTQKENTQQVMDYPNRRTPVFCDIEHKEFSRAARPHEHAKATQKDTETGRDGGIKRYRWRENEPQRDRIQQP